MRFVQVIGSLALVLAACSTPDPSPAPVREPEEAPPLEVPRSGPEEERQPDEPRAPEPIDSEAAEQLAELGHPSAENRHRAERWLAAHVTTDDLPALTGAARRGNPEIRQRIARVLATADGDLTLCTAFLADDEPFLAEIGREALRERIARWNPTLSNPGERDSRLADWLEGLGREHAPRAIHVDPSASLGAICGLLQRHAEMPVGLTFEHDVGAQRNRVEGAVAFSGTWADVLLQVASSYAVGLDAHGFAPDADLASQQMGFVRACRLADAGRTSGIEILLGWFAGAFQDPDPAARSAAARNLAASGWPDALAWMEARYRRTKDETALEGLLWAAASGRIAPVLFEGEHVQTLVRRAEQGLDSGTELAFAHRILDGLSRLGCLGRDGDDLTQDVLAGWEGASGRGRWLRLALLEGMRCPGAADWALQIAADGSAPAALRVQGLRTWVATSATRSARPVTRLPEVEDLLATGDTPSVGAELAGLLVSGGFLPPEELRDPGLLPASFGLGERTTVFGWFLGTEDYPTAARHALALQSRAPGDAFARGEALAEVLSFWLGRGDRSRVAPTLWAAREEVAGEQALLELDRAALLVGMTPPERGLEVFRAITQGALGPGPDLRLLSVGAGWGLTAEGLYSRDRLAALLATAFEANQTPQAAAPLIGAVEAAMVALQEQWFDDLAETWRRNPIQRLVRDHRQSRLARSLPRNWPPYPVLETRDLAALDRRLPPEL